MLGRFRAMHLRRRRSVEVLGAAARVTRKDHDDTHPQLAAYSVSLSRRLRRPRDRHERTRRQEAPFGELDRSGARVTLEANTPASRWFIPACSVRSPWHLVSWQHLVSRHLVSSDSTLVSSARTVAPTHRD